MEIDRSSRRRGPLSEEEKLRRERLGLCRYCASNEHVMSSCPKVVHRNVNQSAALGTPLVPSVPVPGVAPYPLHVSPASVNPINDVPNYPPPRQNQLLLGCFLNYGPRQIPFSAFIDSGADSSFMD